MNGQHQFDKQVDGQLDLFSLDEDVDAWTESSDVSAAVSPVAVPAPQPVTDPEPELEQSVDAAPEVASEPDAEPEPEASPETNVAEQAVAPAPPPPPVVSPAADDHALIVLADRVITPSGRKVLGALNTMARFQQLIDWCCEHKTRLGAPPQIWITSHAVIDALGWALDPNDPAFAKATNELQGREIAMDLLKTRVTDTVEEHLAPPEYDVLITGVRLYIRRTTTVPRPETRFLEVILVPYASLLPGRPSKGILGAFDTDTGLPEDDDDLAVELGRRIAWWAEHLKVLPSTSAARSGATLRDQIAANRSGGTRKGARKVTATDEPSPEGLNPMPPLFGAHPNIEQEMIWGRVPTLEEIAAAAGVEVIDQRASYLASSGMLSLGYGSPVLNAAADANEQARSNKTVPYGLWHVTLPAGKSLNLPRLLPLPHPRMSDDEPVDAWITTVSLDALCSPVIDGGAGLDLDDLDISEAWIWPKEGRTLNTWAKVLREARKAADDAGDHVMKSLVGEVYKGYVGRMSHPDHWPGTNMKHHHQPMWRWSIIAHARQRSRRAAMRIANEHGLWPIKTITDSWYYLTPNGVTLGDTAPELGKFPTEKHALLTPAVRKKFAAISRNYAALPPEQKADIAAVARQFDQQLSQLVDQPLVSEHDA